MTDNLLLLTFLTHSQSSNIYIDIYIISKVDLGSGRDTR